jgi:hypothetical protein
MGIERTWTIGTGAATVAAVLALGAGATLGQGGASASQDADIGTTDATTCVLGPEPAGPAAPPWIDGLMARSDGLNRTHDLGRHAPGGPCADVPDWLRALILRSDGMNRAGNLGRYAPAR